jgi:hypothetical protein
MKTKSSILSLLGVSLVLGACDGPWNMSVEDQPADRSLWVSSVQVAGRAFDTIWIEDNSPLGVRFDETVPVATTASVIRVFQDSAGIRDTVTFVMASSRPRAWVPRSEDAAKRVRWNALLDFSGDVLLADGSRRALSASTYTQGFYALADSFAVPLETLHPKLANGEFRTALKAAGTDTAKVMAAIFALDPTLAFVTRWKLNPTELLQYANGLPVMRNISVKGDNPDTVWYISDMTPVLGLAVAGSPARPLPAEYRQWIFRHAIDKDRFGGLVLTQGFDPTRARILGSVYKQFGSTFAVKDSSRFFQRGGSRSWLVAPKVFDDLPGYPDSAIIANNFFGYTGKNRVYAWAVDSLYYEFYRTITGETGDGQYSVTNIKGGKGYFTGAGLDSAAFQMEAAFADTVPVPRLQSLWCDSVVARQKRGEASAVPKSQVTQFCGDK